MLPAALKFAHELSENTSLPAIAITKGLVWHAADNVEEQHLLDSRGIRSLTGNNDAAEGAKAFKEKRPVKFTDTLSDNLPNWVPWVCFSFKHDYCKLRNLDIVEGNKHPPSQGEVMNWSEAKARPEFRTLALKPSQHIEPLNSVNADKI